MKKTLKVPFFFDLKSPFSFLAKDQVYRLQRTFDINVEFLPYDFSRRSPNLFVPDQRSPVEWLKIKYFYKDLRRFANERTPPLIIKGPLRLYDSSIANIGSLFCLTKSEDLFKAYIDEIFQRFFLRELEIEDQTVIFDIILGAARKCSVPNVEREEFIRYLSDEGKNQLNAIEKRGDEMGVFGVPTVFVDEEMYFGNDRMDFVEKHLGKIAQRRL